MGSLTPEELKVIRRNAALKAAATQKAKYGADWFKLMGQIRASGADMAAVGRKGNKRAGGLAVLAKYGPDHFKKLSALAHAKRKAKQELTIAAHEEAREMFAYIAKAS